MNLYLISQSAHSYYVYDSAVVAAESEDDARIIHPNGYGEWSSNDLCEWCTPEQVKVQHIGTANPGAERGVICASFNAG